MKIMAFYYKPLSTIFLMWTNLFFLCLILMTSSSEAAAATTSYTLDLIHRDSPSSPFYDPSQTRLQRQAGSFLRSIARSSSNLLSAPVSPFSGEYVTKFRIGTPPVEVLAIVDTHSDLTWTQCVPCRDNVDKVIECYKQKTPLFDPRNSKTYRNLTCGSDQCALLDDASPGLLPACDHDQQPCSYYVFYKEEAVDESRSGGDIALETFTFVDGDNIDSVKVVFGCGHDNMGGFVEKASGVLGLARGSVSLVNQLASGGGARYFSYCLTSESDRSDSDAASRIRFGSTAIVGPGPKVGSTPLRKGPGGTVRNFYSVTLEGISVGNQRLEYSSSPKIVKRVGNIFIDSSTAMTVLPSSFYDRLESALVNGTRAKRVPDPRKTNGLCFSKGNINYPVITAHFQGVDLVLSNENTFSEVGVGVVCSTFLRGVSDEPSVAIFGNMHQRNILIGFDLDNHKVDFLPTDCAKPQ
ncbi:hypothetical protein ACP275_14G026900 [Erythranthe tilingii]